jgi:hypothetical protein
VENLGPDFVCIGAQKAGTTWLYDFLRQQGAFRMPPLKEVHFFNTVCANEELLGVEGRDLRFKKQIREAFEANPSIRTAQWLRRWYLGGLSTEWYHNLFKRSQGDSRIAGDITPAYSTLDERGVRFARRVLSHECRVFLVVREPVDRVWSAVKMWHRWAGKQVRPDDVDALMARVNMPSHRLRGDYPRIVRLWRSVFRQRFRVFRYDQLVMDPQGFLRDLGEFLDTPIDVEDAALRRRSNYDPAKIELPDPVRRALRRQFAPQVLELDSLLPGIAEAWGYR